MRQNQPFPTLALIDASMQSLLYAWRSLRRRPGLIVAIVLTLGLGLGANAAMFAVIDRSLFHAPPYLRDPGEVNRVYVTWHVAPAMRWLGRDPLADVMSYLGFRDLSRWTTDFSQTAAFASQQVPVGSGLGTRELTVAPVSASLFSFFDAAPVVGRYFTAAEDTPPEGAAVAVLSYAFWHSQYGGRSNIIGRDLQVDRERYTIIGVAPQNFVGMEEGAPPSVFVPLTTYPAAIGYPDDSSGDCGYLTSHCQRWLQMIVRRRPGVSAAVASTNLTNAFQRSYVAHRSEFASPNDTNSSGQLPPIAVARPRAIAGPVLAARGPLENATARVATWVTGVAIVVLLIACANVTNLLLSRSSEREGEIALRLALGISQQRLGGQLLVECVLLALLSGVVSLVVAWLGGSVLTSLFIPTGAGAGLLNQPRTLLFGAAVTLLTGIVIGVAPALHARRIAVTDALRGGNRGSSPDRSRTQGMLLLLQSGLSVLLLVGAGLFTRSAERVGELHLGYDVRPVLYADLEVRQTKIDSVTGHRLALRLVDVAKAIPGVTDAARVYGVPLLQTVSDKLFVPGIDSVGRFGHITEQSVSPEYFHTVGTRIVEGRGFTDADAAHAPRVAIISQAMAQALWPGQDPIGKRMRVYSDTAPYTTVVGVAENTRQLSLSDGHELSYYLPIDQDDNGLIELFIRSRGDARAFQATVRRAMQSVAPGDMYVNVTPMEELIEPEVRSWRIGTELFVALGGLALVVAAVGLYSVMSYDVARRRHELGVRIALGARPGDVLRLLTTDSTRFVIIGAGIGSAIALACGSSIAPLLFAESPRDPVVFGVAALVLAAAACLATMMPALSAWRVDPNTALRTE
jgi:predicted permease